MLWFNVLIFALSCLALMFSSKWLVGSMAKIAKFLGWKEFVVGFFIMAVATSLPNLFIGVISAFNKVPQLALGDVVGANIFDLSVVLAISAFISRAGLSARSRTVQSSAVFTMGIAILPLLLLADGLISRLDGLLLIAAFIFYIFWVFGKKERFEKVYDDAEKIGFASLFKSLGIFLLSVVFLLLSAGGFVKSSLFFADAFQIPLGLIGMFVIGVGGSLPESFFSWQAAKKGEDWLLLGNLMGGIIIVATLVLGVTALIYPIQVEDSFPFVIARIFLIISAIAFWFFVRSDSKITKKEGVFLLAIYLAFLITEILAK